MGDAALQEAHGCICRFEELGRRVLWYGYRSRKKEPDAAIDGGGIYVMAEYAVIGGGDPIEVAE